MTDTAPRGWNPATPEQKAEQQAAKDKAASDREEWARLHAAVFSGGAGKQLLDAYHKRIIDQVLSENADDRALAALNVKRHFVRQLEQLTEQGGAAKRQKSKG